jgi:hypothetical protein
MPVVPVPAVPGVPVVPVLAVPGVPRVPVSAVPEVVVVLPGVLVFVPPFVPPVEVWAETRKPDEEFSVVIKIKAGTLSRAVMPRVAIVPRQWCLGCLWRGLKSRLKFIIVPYVVTNCASAIRLSG